MHVILKFHKSRDKETILKTGRKFKRERQRETNGIKRNYKIMKENPNSHNVSQRKGKLYFQNAKRKLHIFLSEFLVPSEKSKKFPKKEYQKEEKLSQNKGLKCQ